MSEIMSEAQTVLEKEMNVETMAPPAPTAVVAEFVAEEDPGEDSSIKTESQKEEGRTLLVLGSDSSQTNKMELAGRSNDISQQQEQKPCRSEDLANIVILAEASEGRVLEQEIQQQTEAANPTETPPGGAKAVLEGAETAALEQVAPNESEAIDVKPSIAVQANDYEIERSGILPARRRIIPYKFRDFRDPESTGKEDPFDHEYTPPASLYGRGKRRPARKGAAVVKKAPRLDHAYERADAQITSLVKGIPSEWGKNENKAAAAVGKNTLTEQEASSTVALGEAVVDVRDRIIPSIPKRGRPPKDGSTAHRTNSSQFKCTQCDKFFSSKGNLKVHKQTHTDHKPFVCNIAGCEKAFRTNESLKRHKLAHMGIKLFECEYCQSRFSSNVALKEHIARHTDTKPHTCPLCQRSFRQVSCMRRHLSTHSNEQPHICTICGRSFAQMVYLRSHMRSHTGERPFPCTHCDKKFRHQSDLQRHQAVHTGAKNYECEECGARFTDPSSRRRHIREHTGFKPYKCQLCGDFFKRAGQLRIHLIKKHNNFSGILGPVGVDVRTANLFAPAGSEVEVISIDKVAHVLEVIDDGVNKQVQQKQLQSGDSQLQQQQAKTQQSQAQNPAQEVEEGSEPTSHPQIVQILASNQCQQSPASAAPSSVSAVNTDGVGTMATSAGDASSQAAASLGDGSKSESPDKEKILEEARRILEQMRTHILGDINNEKGESEQNAAVAAEGLLSLPSSATETPAVNKDCSGQKEQLLEETRHMLEQIHTQFESSPDGSIGQVAYQIYQDGDGSPQIVEIQYHTQGSPSKETASAVIEELVQTPSGILATDANSGTPDYVSQPDFESQDYYNWLSNFTELCKLVPVPLDVDLFQKISQVTKTLTDVLANPRGILANRENFTTLMGISRELNGIINEHLSFILQNLDGKQDV